MNPPLVGHKNVSATSSLIFWDNHSAECLSIFASFFTHVLTHFRLILPSYLCIWLMGMSTQILLVQSTSASWPRSVAMPISCQPMPTRRLCGGEESICAT